MDIHSLSHMRLKPFSFIYLFSVGKFLPMDDVNFKIDPIDRKYMSNHTFMYLKKMKALCDSRGVEFVLYMAPIHRDRVAVTNDFMQVKGRVKGTVLEGLFDRYFRTMIVMDDDYFRDGFHFHNHIIEKEQIQIGRMVLDKIRESSEKS